MELSLQQIAQCTEGTIHGENVTLSDILKIFLFYCTILHLMAM